MNVETKSYSVEDLTLFLNDMLIDVQTRIAAAQNKHKISSGAIYEYLEVDNPDLIDAIREVTGSVDSDILKRVAEGAATDDECEDWMRGMQDWCHLVIEGINSFEEFHTLSFVA